MKNSRKIIILALSFLGIIALVWGAAFAFSKSSNTQPEKNTNSSSEQNTKKLPTGTIDESRKEALLSVENILNVARENPTNETIEERTTKLDSRDFSVVSNKLSNEIIFSDTFKESESLQANTYQAVIYIAEILQDNPTATELSWKNVFVDQNLGIAYVPLSVFKPDAGLFHFEMVYVDGEWKLLPNSFVNSVLLGSSISNTAE